MTDIAVWTLSAVLSLLTGRFILQNAVNIPFMDDWAIFWWLAKGEVSAKWLWSPHNEHRIPLSKLLFIAAHFASGGDFRAGCWVVWGMLTLLTVALLLLARKIRGRTTWSDLFFPLTLLHFGHYENLLWSFQIQFAGSALLTGLLLVLVVWHSDGPRRGCEIALVAACGVALFGFGSSAVAFAPLPILWLAWLGWRRWKEPTPAARRQAILAWVASTICLTVLIGYFAGLAKFSPQTPNPSLWSVLLTSVQFWQTGLSPFLATYWPYPGLLIGLALVWVAVKLLWALRGLPAERSRNFGLLLFLGGFLGLTAGIGWSRTGIGYSPRYATLSSGALCLVYVTALLLVPVSRRQLTGNVLCLLMLVSYWNGFEQAPVESARRRNLLQSFERDLRRGDRTVTLADRYSFLLDNPIHLPIFPFPEHLALSVANLRQRRIGPFQPVPADGDLQMEWIDPIPSGTSGVAWDANRHSLRVTAPAGKLSFVLPAPRFVQRIYFQPRLLGTVPQSGIEVVITCARPRPQDEPVEKKLTISAAVQVVSIPVEEVVTGFDLTFPAMPCEFRFGTDSDLWKDYKILLATGRPVLTETNEVKP